MPQSTKVGTDGSAIAGRAKSAKSKRISAPLAVIGWREWLGIPQLGVAAMKVKVDTGARTSALHAFDMETYEEAGEPWIRFSIHPRQRSSEFAVTIEAPLDDERYVRPSTGRATLRPVIRVPVRLGEAVWPIEITLVQRDMMGFRMLLGRQAIRGRYLVDTKRSYVAGRPGELVAVTPIDGVYRVSTIADKTIHSARGVIQGAEKGSVPE